MTHQDRQVADDDAPPCAPSVACVSGIGPSRAMTYSGRWSGVVWIRMSRPPQAEQRHRRAYADRPKALTPPRAAASGREPQPVGVRQVGAEAYRAVRPDPGIVRRGGRVAAAGRQSARRGGFPIPVRHGAKDAAARERIKNADLSATPRLAVGQPFTLGGGGSSRLGSGTGAEPARQRQGAPIPPRRHAGRRRSRSSHSAADRSGNGPWRLMSRASSASSSASVRCFAPSAAT